MSQPCSTVDPVWHSIEAYLRGKAPYDWSWKRGTDSIGLASRSGIPMTTAVECILSVSAEGL